MFINLSWHQVTIFMLINRNVDQQDLLVLIHGSLSVIKQTNKKLIENFDAVIMQFMPRVIHDAIFDLFVWVVGNCCIICSILFRMICQYITILCQVISLFVNYLLRIVSPPHGATMIKNFYSKQLVGFDWSTFLVSFTLKLSN